MKVFDSFEMFWNELAPDKRNAFNFHDWQVVQVVHTSDEEYQKQRLEGRDELGFQPLSVVLANPLSQQTQQILIKHVSSKLAADFKEYCRKQYYTEFPNRLGSFRPDTFHAFAEYDNWESFDAIWLQRDGRPVFHQNIPLLLDHTPKIEYWTRKQTGQEIMPYQRPLITTYFVSKNKFFDFFIKDIDDSEAQRIQLLTQSRIGLSLDELYSSAKVEAYAETELTDLAFETDTEEIVLSMRDSAVDTVIYTIPQLKPAETLLPAIIENIVHQPESLQAAEARIILAELLEPFADPETRMELGKTDTEKLFIRLKLLSERLDIEDSELLGILEIDPDTKELNRLSELQYEILHGLKKLISLEYSSEFTVAQVQSDDAAQDGHDPRTLGQLVLRMLQGVQPAYPVLAAA